MTSVLISGASIAGPALAFWLRKHGFDVTVVERAPALRPGGQAVDLRGTAKIVAERMGLAEQIRAACTDTAGDTTVDKHGNPLVSHRAEDNGGDGPIAEIEILRGDLSQVLYDATKADAEYVFGDRITALRDTGDHVNVTFAEGPERTFDFVVGADGLHSGVRAMLFGDEAQYLRFLGLYLAFWTLPNHLELDNWSLSYEENGVSAGIRPIHGNRDAMAYLGFESEQIEFDYRDVEQQKALVREHADGLGWEVPEMIKHIDTAPDFYFDSASQVLLDSWSRGRVGLIGDAAFCPSPLTGQGTSLALVGAYLLAGELAADPANGLVAYERRLRDWVLQTQKVVHGDLAPGEYIKLVNAFELPDY